VPDGELLTTCFHDDHSQGEPGSIGEARNLIHGPSRSVSDIRTASRRHQVRQQAADRCEGVNIFVRDLIVAPWQCDNEVADRPVGRDPAWQGIFITVALDAILSSLGDGTPRQRTHDAYRRRLERHGLSD